MKCEDCSHAEMCKWIDELGGRGCDFLDVEQQPCEDAISKTHVKKLYCYEICTVGVNCKDMPTLSCNILKKFDNMPSVTPSNKIIEDIKAEIQAIMDMYEGCEYIGDKARRDELWHVLEIIDKHIGAEMESKEE